MMRGFGYSRLQQLLPTARLGRIQIMTFWFSKMFRFNII